MYHVYVENVLSCIFGVLITTDNYSNKLVYTHFRADMICWKKLKYI